ncbi:hypothetical protein [Candidatus Amarobacter glycogenicus]|uniref:hypothetical protein n=1 Tax=Candidatus Amarobacter glycogenicus TaxID=3140699 RepID=UPI003136E57C|nr:hypothetical protein [Dehalococcoidia bacterium]
MNINNITEGNLTPACILLQVTNGLVNITEQLTAGFTAEGWTINNPASSGSGGTVEFELSSDGCFDTEERLVGTLVGLVRQAISVVTVVTEGDPICTVTFRNHDDQNNEPTGAIRVEKYLDINGDGDANDTGEGLIPGWDVTIAGPVVNGTFDLADGTYSWLGLETGDVYMLTEATVAGYTVTNATVNGVTIGASTFAGAAVPNGGFTIVRFYNKPQGSIIVHKVAVTRQGFGPETDAPNDDDGWTITVSSAQCGINISKQTDANGNAVFAGLPLCTDYVVSENPVNASSPGFNPVSPVSVSGQTPNGQTITFKNRKDAEDPRCTVNCGPSTATPTTPTTPPTTVVPPTTTPIPPVIPPVTQVAGEKTPGASATPIAPSTGGGIIGGATGGTNLVLIIAGILALTSGLSFVALGRKSRR